MPSTPTISVILPALNEARNIRRALESVADADERIVVDGGSCDETKQIAQSVQAIVLETAPGRGTQLRAGARAASGDLLLFLHADCWLGPGVIQQLRVWGECQPRAFGAFQQQIDDSRFRFRWLEAGNAIRAKYWGIPYGDQAMFADRRSYDAVGGFGEDPLMEDVILARKLRRIVSPVLLSGPVCVHARRWLRRGVISQTLRNWSLLSAYYAGISTHRLARWYG